MSAEAIPKRIGDCTHTRITEIGNRLGDTPGSGSLVVFSNGLHQVSYEQIPEVDESRVGDSVLFCLFELPKDCPPGDDRGKVYKTTDLRSHKSWRLPDQEHDCGGA